MKNIVLVRFRGGLCRLKPQEMSFVFTADRAQMSA